MLIESKKEKLSIGNKTMRVFRNFHILYELSSNSKNFKKVGEKLVNMEKIFIRVDNFKRV